ncbi:MAG TPA: LmeA family phospholipid-binding protein [Egibacteraceae bacterium]|jgi:hypothetical protein|nr:LmeA family phospholipid-binding protein [Egibacteraceae bacterium]
MKKVLVGLLLLLAVVALAIEVVAPQLAEARIEEHVQARTEGAVGVSADVGTFPVVTRLLATERLPRLAVTLDEVAGQQLTFTSVRFELRGVSLDRDALLAGNVRVRGMQSGHVTVTADAAALQEAIGAPVRLEGGSVIADVAGRQVQLPLALEGGALRLPGGLPTLALPDVVPCTTADTAVLDGRIELSCALEEVPLILT